MQQSIIRSTKHENLKTTQDSIKHVSVFGIFYIMKGFFTVLKGIILPVFYDECMVNMIL